jgi:type IV secretory pathway VirD2 relaxase
MVGTGAARRTSLAALQRVVVKVSYEKIGKLKERLDYIRQEEKAQAQEVARVFDAKRNEIDAEAVIERWQSAGDDIFFKIPISPEKSAELVQAVMKETGLPEREAREEMLRQLARATMEAAEKDWGTKVQWLAASHFDTKQLHAHVFLRAVTEDGNPMRIDRDYIREGFRTRAAQWATRKLGQFRTEQEIRQGIEKSQSIRQEILSGKLRIEAAERAGRLTKDEAFKLRRGLGRGDVERTESLRRIQAIEQSRGPTQEI